MRTGSWCLFLFSFFLFASDLQAAPPSGLSWKKIAEFSDEFDGEHLDASKWYPLNPKWVGRFPSFFSRENVRLRDGNLVIFGTKVDLDDPFFKKGIRYFTGTLKSQRPIKYGYFEVRAKIGDSRISSSFWLYDHSKVTWTEIDIFELCGKPPCSKFFHTNLHARVSDPLTGGFVDKEWPKKFASKEILSESWFVAGFEWGEDWLRWYVDGKLIREEKNTHWHDPLYVVLDSEVFEKWFGEPESSELPSEFFVDYVRVWQVSN